MRKQPRESWASPLFEKLRALFAKPPVLSVERVGELSSEHLRSWAAEQARKFSGQGHAIALSRKKDALTALLIDDQNEFVFDEGGARVAKRFEFTTLSPDLEALLAGDELVVLTF